LTGRAVGAAVRRHQLPHRRLDDGTPIVSTIGYVGSMSTRWGIYRRQSHVSSAEKIGASSPRVQAAFERQEAACRDLVASKGGTVVAVYSDEGIGAYKKTVRPDFECILNDLEVGYIEGLAAWKLDRLTRNQEDLSRLWDVIQKSGAVLACVHDAVDTSTPAGEFAVRTTVDLAGMESANLGLRVAAQREQAARAGRPGYGGTRPYGYEADKRTIVPVEAAVARDAAMRLLAGQSLRSVAHLLNLEGKQTTTGKPWSPALLRQMLSRPRMAGLREHKGAILGKADWPAILDCGTWEQLRQLFAHPGRRSQVGRPRLFMLVGGLARCGAPGTVTIGDITGICGRPLISGRRTDPRGERDGRRYLCAPTTAGGCGRVSVDRGYLEDAVSDALAKALATPGLDRALAASAPNVDTALAQQIGADNDKLVELGLMWARNQIGTPECLAARQEIKERIIRNSRRLANLAAKGPLAALEHKDDVTDMRAQLDRLDLDRLRAVADAVLEAVIVYPAGTSSNGGGTRGGGRFDPDRIDYAWKV
jgi:site-specific DNA recombinase